LFQKPRERITRQQAVTVLCPAVFSSPFVLHDTGFLVDLFNRSVEAGTKDEAVQFIQEKLDAGFFNVDAVPSHESAEFTRFKVTHKTFKTAVDLTQFGEGVQRIFHISLLFAYARGGVVLIDEFENAIHYTLLKAFTRFVQELAVKFDVQVFISSHSKECVDAFVTNDFGLHDVSAYALRRDNGRRVAHHYDGPRLRQLIEVADVDLRGQEAKI
jgi:AAA15 family ATPase/GTPase